LRLVASGEDSVWIVDANDLASLQGDLAIVVQGLDHATVGLQGELGDLDLTSNSDPIDIVAGDLGTLEGWTVHSDKANLQGLRSQKTALRRSPSILPMLLGIGIASSSE
jgi:hypothetical protein